MLPVQCALLLDRPIFRCGTAYVKNGANYAARPEHSASRHLTVVELLDEICRPVFRVVLGLGAESAAGRVVRWEDTRTYL